MVICEQGMVSELGSYSEKRRNNQTGSLTVIHDGLKRDLCSDKQSQLAPSASWVAKPVAVSG